MGVREDWSPPALNCAAVPSTAIGADAVRMEGTPKDQAIWTPVYQSGGASRKAHRGPKPRPPAPPGFVHVLFHLDPPQENRVREGTLEKEGGTLRDRGFFPKTLS